MRGRWLICLLLIALSMQAIAGRKREMRGAWVATVANIDWPSSRDSSAVSQKQELVSLLDSLCKCGINAVVFQVRPTADALYRSDIEPWSEWLTGKQGKAPSDTLFDPLQIVVEEGHRRCMEVHAWINPYRVTNQPNASLVANHIYYRKPYLFKKYGGKIIFDPGVEETADYLLTVLRDIVRRYDIDALHLDDYFYPYPVAGVEFPDDETFKRNPRGFANKDDWRRDNVNRVIRRIHEMLEKEKPWVQLGVSPFGVWRNKSKDEMGSDTKAGITNYDDLYADVLLWMKNGWIDYVAPQLYWEIGKKAADYAVLAPWWRAHTPSGCRLYFGLFASGLEINKPKAWKTPNELVRQMRYNDECNLEIDGLVFYSTHYLLKNPQGILDSLRHDFYQTPAITPEKRNYQDAIFPIGLNLDGDTLRWTPVVADGGEKIAHYVVYAFPDTSECDFDDSRNIYALTTEPFVALNKTRFDSDTNYCLTVTSVNRFRSESEPYEFVTFKRK